MGCGDEWARELDKKMNFIKNKKISPIMLGRNERFLRFSTNKNRSFILRNEFIRKKYGLEAEINPRAKKKLFGYLKTFEKETIFLKKELDGKKKKNAEGMRKVLIKKEKTLEEICLKRKTIKRLKMYV